MPPAKERRPCPANLVVTTRLVDRMPLELTAQV